MNPDEELPPEIAARGYYHQAVWKRIVVIAAGPAVNLVIAFVILFALSFGIREATDRVERISPGTPAQGKLERGDRIISVDGVRGDQETLADQINSHDCAGEQRDGCLASTPAHLLVERDGRLLRLTIRPRYDASVDRNRIGFAFGSKPVNPSVLEAAGLAGKFMGSVATATVEVFVRIFDPEQREQISGVVGSYEVTRQAIEFDERRALALIAVISLSLALINLFPFLPLDGGHIFWSVVEKVRGRPVPFSVMERAGAVGFVLVILLFFIGLSNDIGRLTGEGFRTR
jgi:regulator of sigma E protease